MQADWDQWYATGYRALDVLERELCNRDFLLGDNYSAADICFYGYAHCAEEGGFSLDDHPNVQRWRSVVQRQRAHVRIDDVGPVFPTRRVEPQNR